jgi:LacI family transcriptional regulator
MNFCAIHVQPGRSPGWAAMEVAISTNPTKAPVTISQVAKAVGVNRSSVSRAFSRPDLLNPETVARIKEVADQLGYVPNYSARALSTGRHGNIALVVPDVANPFFPPMIRAVQNEADRLDFCVFLGNGDEEPRQEAKLVGRFSGQVEGIVLASSRLSADHIRDFAALKPLVLINRDVPGIPRVLIDSGSGVGEAVAHLAALGHRRIAYISGPSSSWSNKQRRAAVKKAAEGLGLEVITMGAQVPSHAAGQRAVAFVLEGAATAAIAFDDLTAQGMLAGFAERGIAVPDDMAVVGCDDVLGAMTYPPLTTVSNRASEAGQIATRLLLEILSRRVVSDVRYLLETHLVVRQTTARGGGYTPGM